MAKVIKGVFPETAKDKPAPPKEPVPSYILHISLMFSDPLIWRKVQVPGDYSLARLHEIIQTAMGWSDSFVHQFMVGKISYEPTIKSSIPRESKRFDEHKYKLHTLEEGMQFMFSYLYDAGEGWEHEITLEEVVPPGKELNHPVLLAGENSCPPEEVGDVHQYNQLVSAFTDPQSKDHMTLLELSGRPDFDPASFNLEAVGKLIRKL
ncbi:plasmid pRiA4b ORF-3 family protein [Desulforhopalus singaporensis]|uniref:PRiA4b ORF-3-like protein n=1 Tax=Desulforhopalus singaporensis TaxID=91360 RepID=A0A1H0UHM5_9BACT|nr:plasmid pRiA4b ORF-3 family protein [Desulforhopalus singaporensis]SDP65651.1 pRiA4b ORF-3-like protein [Desulforhopalus singaporensis]